MLLGSAVNALSSAEVINTGVSKLHKYHLNKLISFLRLYPTGLIHFYAWTSAHMWCLCD